MPKCEAVFQVLRNRMKIVVRTGSLCSFSIGIRIMRRCSPFPNVGCNAVSKEYFDDDARRAEKEHYV